MNKDIKYRVLWGTDSFMDQSDFMDEESAQKMYDEIELNTSERQWVKLVEYCMVTGTSYCISTKFIKIKTGRVEEINGPKILEVTTLDDTSPVYELVANFDDLSDHEKKLMYESKRYLANKNSFTASRRLNDLVVVCDYLNKFKWLLPKRIKYIVDKYVD